MNPRSSQPLIWTSVALCTAALYAGAYKWVRVRIPIEEPEKKELAIIDLGMLQALPEAIEEPAPEITPEPEPIPEPMPEPEPEPVPEPEPEPISEPEPEPMPEPPPPPEVVEPTPPPKPKIDPEIVKKQREAEAARVAEKKQQAANMKAVEEKRQRQAAALRAEAARKKAAAALANKVTTKPSAISQPRPSYPSSARRAGHEGTVTVNFTVGSNGRVSSVRVSKSSGHQSLDSAAVSTISKWKFKPARNGLGEATSYQYSIPVPFRLK